MAVDELGARLQRLNGFVGVVTASRYLTLPVNAFIARFLQHVLPRGLTKVRSYGLLSPGRFESLQGHAPA